MLLKSVFVLILLLSFAKNEPPGWGSNIGMVHDTLLNYGEIVFKYIVIAHDVLEDLRVDIISQSFNVVLNAEFAVQQERVNFEQKLASLKEIAMAAEANITSCLDVNEDYLQQLPETYLIQIKKCILTIQQKGDKDLEDTRYNIDIYFNQMAALNASVYQCTDSDSDCLAEVHDQIETLVDVPPQILAEISSTNDSVSMMKDEIQNCYVSGIDEYIGEATGIMQYIIQCTDAIIS